MPVPQDRNARRFYHVAYQRLEDGQLILNTLDRPNASIYLTGYAVECMLKALLIANTPANLRENIAASFRGSRAHDLEWLRIQLINSNVPIHKQIHDDLRFLNTWSPALRYEPGDGDREDAEYFCVTARRILDWANERMG